MYSDYFVKWNELDKTINEKKTENQYTKFISTDSYNNVFVTNNLVGDRGFLIEFEPFILKDYKPRKVNGLIVDVEEKKNIDESKLYLEVKNANREYDHAFIGFSVICFDAIARTQSDEEALLAYERVVDEYHNFFQYKNELPKESEQGLMAELLYLDECIIKNGQQVINNWHGCEKNKRDFIFEHYGVEIKSSRNQEQDIISISNENQLDKGILNELYLKLYIFDESSVGKKVEDCIRDILDKLSSVEYKKIFLSKIALLNINPYEYKGKYSFKLEKVKTYCVDEDFPKITKNTISNCIFDVKYRVNISDIKCVEEVNGND